jgi:hypothetical protein
MCKTPCCQPRGGSGPGATIAVITAIIVVPIALRLLIEVLKLIELILVTLTATALLGLLIWAAICWHRHALTRASQAQVLYIAANPATGLPATMRPRRTLTTPGEHTARPLAITAAHHDPAPAGSYIRARRAPRT